MARKLIIVGIDGCHRDILYSLIDGGEAKFFRALTDNGLRVKDAVTMFPSTTGCCCATLYTGAWYKNHGILNNEWMDRFARPPAARSYIAGMRYALASMDRKLFGFPSILLPNLGKGGSFNNDLGVPTIFEELARAGLTSFSFFHYYGKGATKWIRPSRMDMLRYGLVEQYSKPFQMYEKHMVTKAIMNMKRGMPDLTALYFGCNDGHSHRHGVPAQREYLRDFVDPELARFDEAVRRRHPDDEIFWAITADHGQTNLTEADVDKCIWYDSFNPVLRAAGYEKIERGLSDSQLDPADVVVSLGNGATLGFYLKSRKAGVWKALPDFDIEIAPVLNNFLRASAGMSPFSDWKYPGCVDFLLTRRHFEAPYSVYVHHPPYEGVGRLVDVADYFAGAPADYVRPVERIRGLDHPKNADIILVLNYRDRYNVNEPGAFHPGQHGGLFADDSFVPMIFSGPGIKRGEIPGALTIDFAPTAASILGVGMPSADGGILPIF